jgi:hypothetical protein
MAPLAPLPLGEQSSPFPFPNHVITPVSPMDVITGVTHASARDALAWSSSTFIAGSIALPYFRPCWDIILEDHPRAPMITSWLTDGVRPSAYWHRYTGEFEDTQYDSTTPPRRRFDNHRSASSNDLVGSPLKPPQLSARQFVDGQIAKNLASGAVIRWRDHVDYDPQSNPMPHLVLPLGVEPEKPRLIWDGRFLNLWQREISFTMESLSSVPNLDRS